MTDDVSIYQSDPDATIERLAALDSSACPRDRVLVAAVAGEPRAALPLDGSPPIADPFHRTAELVSFLEMRVAHLNGRFTRKRLFVLPTTFGRGRPLAASGQSRGTATAIHAASLS